MNQELPNADQPGELEPSAVIQEFLVNVGTPSEFFIDMEKQAAEAVRINPNLLAGLSRFNRALEDKATRAAMQWVLGRNDVREAITDLLKNAAIKKTEEN